MKNYIFIVRPWNVSFFLKLKQKISRESSGAEFTFLTMHWEAYSALKGTSGVIFLPEVMQQVKVSDTLVAETDLAIRQKFDYGINRLFDLERFRPENMSNNEFIGRHIAAINTVLIKPMIFISLTMDHFAYILTGHLNLINSGKNYFVQNIGFPQYANIICNTPWMMNKFREVGLPEKNLNEYINSLSFRPEESVHYMKPSPVIKLTLKQKINEFIRRYAIDTSKKKLDKNFYYFDANNKVKLAFIDRFRRSSKPEWTERSYSFTQLKDLKVNTKCNIFYFPLQFEPEMSTLAYSPFLRNQLEIVRLLSMVIKSTDIIVLKENPKMLGVRESSFYQTIARFPNVIWADFFTNSRDLIRISYKTIAVTGTASIEAACLGINSMIFGYPPQSILLNQKPMSELPLKDFEHELYSNYTKDEILQKIHFEWPEFSRSLIFATIIPVNNGFGKEYLQDEDNLVELFVNDLGLIKVK